MVVTRLPRGGARKVSGKRIQLILLLFFFSPIFKENDPNWSLTTVTPPGTYNITWVKNGLDNDIEISTKNQDETLALPCVVL